MNYKLPSEIRKLLATQKEEDKSCLSNAAIVSNFQWKNLLEKITCGNLKVFEEESLGKKEEPSSQKAENFLARVSYDSNQQLQKQFEMQQFNNAEKIKSPFNRQRLALLQSKKHSNLSRLLDQKADNAGFENMESSQGSNSDHQNITNSSRSLLAVKEFKRASDLLIEVSDQRIIASKSKMK